MTDLVEFPNAVRALWSSGSPTIAPSGVVFLSGTQWGQWNNALVVAVLKGKKLYWPWTSPRTARSRTWGWRYRPWPAAQRRAGPRREPLRHDRQRRQHRRHPEGRPRLAVSVRYEADGPVAVVTIDRPDVANAIDRPTADALADAFRRFDADDERRGGGADRRGREVLRRGRPEGDAAAGRLARHARGARRRRAGGPDAHAARQARHRRGGGPRRGGRPRARGVVRPAGRGGGRGVRRLLPALGHPADGRRHHPARPPPRSQPRARPDPDRPRRERRGGAADGPRQPARTAPGEALAAAIALARELAARPQAALRSDRLSSYEQWSLPLDEALANEYRRGMDDAPDGRAGRRARALRVGRLARAASGGADGSPAQTALRVLFAP